MSEFEPAFNTAFASKVTEQVTANVREWSADPNSFYEVILPEGCEDFKKGDVVVYVVDKREASRLRGSDELTNKAYRTFHFVDGNVVGISATFAGDDVLVSYENNKEKGITFLVYQGYDSCVSYANGMLIDTLHLGLIYRVIYEIGQEGFILNDVKLRDFEGQERLEVSNEQINILLGQVFGKTYSFDFWANLLSGTYKDRNSLRINSVRRDMYPNYLMEFNSIDPVYSTGEGPSVRILERNDGMWIVSGKQSAEPFVFLVDNIEVKGDEVGIHFVGEEDIVWVERYGNAKTNDWAVKYNAVKEALRIVLQEKTKE